MRYMLFALLAFGMATAAQAAPQRDRGHGVSHVAPVRTATAPASSTTRAAIARQATSRRPSAYAAPRSIVTRRAAAQPIVRNARSVRGAYVRSVRGAHASSVRGAYGRSVQRRDGRSFAAARGGRQAAACPRGSRAARCRGERRFAWQSGLPQAAGVQAVSCPSGTVEMPAVGHTTIMRCVPL